MVVQYPHTIIVKWYTEPTTKDNGFVQKGVLVGPYAYECRAEANSYGKKIVGTDGSLIEYTYSVYLPKSIELIPYNAEFVLSGESFGRFKDLGYLADESGRLILTDDNYLIIVNTGVKFLTINGRVKRSVNNQFNSRIWL